MHGYFFCRLVIELLLIFKLESFSFYHQQYFVFSVSVYVFLQGSTINHFKRIQQSKILPIEMLKIHRNIFTCADLSQDFILILDFYIIFLV